jgi:Importin repeat 6
VYHIVAPSTPTPSLWLQALAHRLDSRQDNNQMGQQDGDNEEADNNEKEHDEGLVDKWSKRCQHLFSHRSVFFLVHFISLLLTKVSRYYLLTMLMTALTQHPLWATMTTTNKQWWWAWQQTTMKQQQWKRQQAWPRMDDREDDKVGTGMGDGWQHEDEEEANPKMMVTMSKSDGMKEDQGDQGRRWQAVTGLTHLGHHIPLPLSHISWGEVCF